MHPTLASLGRLLEPEELAHIFQVAPRHIREQYLRYGGVKIGRAVLFFENLVAQTIEKRHALQAESVRESQMERAVPTARREDEAEALQHQGRSRRVGRRTAGDVTGRRRTVFTPLNPHSTV